MPLPLQTNHQWLRSPAQQRFQFIIILPHLVRRRACRVRPGKNVGMIFEPQAQDSSVVREVGRRRFSGKQQAANFPRETRFFHNRRVRLKKVAVKSPGRANIVDCAYGSRRRKLWVLNFGPEMCPMAIGCASTFVIPSNQKHYPAFTAKITSNPLARNQLGHSILIRMRRPPFNDVPIAAGSASVTRNNRVARRATFGRHCFKS